MCERLGISYRKLQRYVAQRLVQPVKLLKGRMRFREEDVDKLMGVMIIRKRKAVLYARVSSSTQKDDLEKTRWKH